MHFYNHDSSHHDSGHHDSDHHSDHHDSGHHDSGLANAILNAIRHTLDVQREGVIPYWLHHRNHQPDSTSSNTSGSDESGGGAVGQADMHYLHFDPVVSDSGIIGNPAYDMTMWHQQEQKDACAIAAQEALLDHFGLHQSEGTLQQQAVEHGWYYPHGGTPMAHIGDLIAYHGLPVVRHEGGTIDELFQALNQHHPAIVAVNGEILRFRGTANDPLGSYPGIPGQQAHHAVEVIGLNVDDLHHPLVILNDSAFPDGQGIEIPLSVFEQAWASSHHFIVRVTDPSSDPHDLTSELDLPDQLVGDAKYDDSWADWNAKNAAYKADWANWNARNETYKDGL